MGELEHVEQKEDLRDARLELRFVHPAGSKEARTSTLRAHAGPDGRYRVCGIPTPAEIEATARAEGAASRTVSFTLSAPERLTLNFTLEPVTTADGVADSLVVDRPEELDESGRSVIAGRLLDEETGRPIGDAVVRLTALDRETLSDRRGRFRIEGVPPGDYELRISHIRYGTPTIEVKVPERQTVALDVRIPPEAIELEAVEVTVESELRLRRLEDRGFYYRRELNFGHFFGPQYLTKWSGTRLPALLARAPGIRVKKGPGADLRLVNQRCAGRPGGMMVYVDGEEWGQMPPDVPVSEVAAIELYRSPSQAVGTLYSGSGCGLVLIWTWHGPNPFHGSATDGYACPERLKRFRSHAC